MNMKDRLKLLDEIKALNDARVKAFLEEEKRTQRWTIFYSFLKDDAWHDKQGIVTAPTTIEEAVAWAEQLLMEVAPAMGWERVVLLGVSLQQNATQNKGGEGL